MMGSVQDIFISFQGGASMTRVEQTEALAGQGLRDDRYCNRIGYYSGTDECQVTIIGAEDLEEIEKSTGVAVSEGQHRRNIVTRGVNLEELRGQKFQVGEAVLEYDRPRPPCSYIQSITEPGMTKALVNRGGLCARVVKSGVIREDDTVVIL